MTGNNVYYYWGENDVSLYVGRAEPPGGWYGRLKSHVKRKDGLLYEIRRIDVVLCSAAGEMLALEAADIRRLRPKYNKTGNPLWSPPSSTWGEKADQQVAEMARRNLTPPLQTAEEETVSHYADWCDPSVAERRERMLRTGMIEVEPMLARHERATGVAWWAPFEIYSDAP